MYIVLLLLLLYYYYNKQKLFNLENWLKYVKGVICEVRNEHFLYMWSIYILVLHKTGSGRIP